MKLFGREPALWINIIAALLSAFVAFQIPGLSAGQAGAITAFLVALAGAWQAFLTRPWSMGLANGAITAGFVLVATFGFEATQEQIFAVQAAVMTVLTFIARGQISPKPPAIDEQVEHLRARTY